MTKPSKRCDKCKQPASFTFCVDCVEEEALGSLGIFYLRRPAPDDAVGEGQLVPIFDVPDAAAQAAHVVKRFVESIPVSVKPVVANTYTLINLESMIAAAIESAVDAVTGKKQAYQELRRQAKARKR